MLWSFHFNAKPVDRIAQTRIGQQQEKRLSLPLDYICPRDACQLCSLLPPSRPFTALLDKGFLLRPRTVFLHSP